MSYSEVALAIGELCKLLDTQPVLVHKENGLLVDTDATIVKINNELRMLIDNDMVEFHG
jgi:hypothetical protein